MKSPIIVTMLLVLAAPAFASPQKDIQKLYNASSRCREYNPDNGSDPAYAIPENENQVSKKACDRSNKLARKLVQQGFCFHKYYNVGWPNKKTGQCDAVRVH